MPLNDLERIAKPGVVSDSGAVTSLLKKKKGTSRRMDEPIINNGYYVDAGHVLSFICTECSVSCLSIKTAWAKRDDYRRSIATYLAPKTAVRGAQKVVSRGDAGASLARNLLASIGGAAEGFALRCFQTSSPVDLHVDAAGVL